MPSSRRQTDATSGAFRVVERRSPDPGRAPARRTAGPRRTAAEVAPRLSRLRRRQRQGRDPVDALAVDAERLPAGGQDAHPRAAAERPRRSRGRRVEHVLAVVEHAAGRPAVAQGVDQRASGSGRPPWPRDAEDARDGRPGPAPASASGARSTNQTPSAVPSSSSAADLQRQPGLAAAARPGEGDQPGATSRSLPISFSSRSRPTNALSWLGRLLGSSGLSSETSGGKSDGSVRGLELEDLLGAGQVLQPVLAQVPQPDAVGQRAGQQVGGGAGDAPPDRRGRWPPAGPSG